MSVDEQYFILNRAYHDLVRMKENVIQMNRRNFRLLNRMFQPQAFKPGKDVKAHQKTASQETVDQVRRKTGLKALEEKRRYMMENKILYKKLFEDGRRANNVGKSWKTHLKVQAKILKQKQHERDMCNQEMRKVNKRDKIVLDKYAKRVAQIRRRRNVEVNKEDFKNARGFHLVDCAKFNDIHRKMIEQAATHGSASNVPEEQLPSEADETRNQISSNSSDMLDSWDSSDADPWTSASSTSYGADSWVAVKSEYRDLVGNPVWTTESPRTLNKIKASKSTKDKAKEAKRKERELRMRKDVEEEVRADLAEQLLTSRGSSTDLSLESENERKKIHEYCTSLVRERENIRKLYQNLLETMSKDAPN